MQRTRCLFGTRHRRRNRRRYSEAAIGDSGPVHDGRRAEGWFDRDDRHRNPHLHLGFAGQDALPDDRIFGGVIETAARIACRLTRKLHPVRQQIANHGGGWRSQGRVVERLFVVDLTLVAVFVVVVASATTSGRESVASAVRPAPFSPASKLAARVRRWSGNCGWSSKKVSTWPARGASVSASK